MVMITTAIAIMTISAIRTAQHLHPYCYYYCYYYKKSYKILLFSVSVSAQDGIVLLGKAHTRYAPSLSSLPKVALETLPMFVWLNTDRS